MEFTAVILAGGRSSRLGGLSKASLRSPGGTLLERSLRSAAGARTIVVVGPPPETPLPTGVLLTREDPPFAGPAAAIAAGLDALAPGAPFTLVLACDMPRSAAGVRALRDALGTREGTAGDGAILVDADGRRQLLAALYRTESLKGSIDDAAARGGLENGSVFDLIARLDLLTVQAPPGSTDDVDTWADAEALGLVPRPTDAARGD